METYCFDAGHGGSDPGAVGPKKTKEADINLDLVMRTARLIVAQGHTVIYTRSTDKFINLTDRADKANKLKTNFFISFHQNAVGNPNTNGTEVFCYSRGGAGERLAKAIQIELVAALRLHDRGVKTANFAVIKRTTMPAALIEVSFLSNPDQETKLNDAAYKDKIAMAIARGIIKGSGQTWKEPKKPIAIIAKDKPLYTVQAGAFKSKTGADETMAKLKKAGIDGFIKTT